MIKTPSITVLKFGSSVLRSPQDLAAIVNEIYRFLRGGDRVIAVVSALGETTNELTKLGKDIGGPDFDHRSFAQLLATGEAQSVACLSLALERAGIPSVPLDAAALNLTTAGTLLSGEPLRFDKERLLSALDDASVVVVPGFVGRKGDEVSLLGRGGSDLTALFLAHYVQARICRLIKDVDGLYERDPAVPGPKPHRFLGLRHDDALEKLDSQVVQRKAIRYAVHHSLAFEVGSLGSQSVTRVGESRTVTVPPEPPKTRTKVALLGLGTVGLGVYQQFTKRSDLYEIVGVAVQDLEKHRHAGLPEGILTDDPYELIARDCDLVVELIGGDDPARDLISQALRSGRDVVTANKQVIALYGPELHQEAAFSGSRLLYNAAVAGAIPILEQLTSPTPGEATGFEAVLNGTTNFVLDRLSEGRSFDEAVLLAQAHGFAEADPSLDLEGWDALYKLVITIRDLFGVELDVEDVGRAGITHLSALDSSRALARGRVLRLVARCRQTEDGVEASVQPVELAFDHFLAGAENEDNRILIHLENGESRRFRGKGAGRWPTTEAVMGDVLEIGRFRQSSPRCVARS